MIGRRWHKKGHAAATVDDWLMTYADMITLLLCFFALFLSLSVAATKNARDHQGVAEQMTAKAQERVAELQKDVAVALATPTPTPTPTPMSASTPSPSVAAVPPAVEAAQSALLTDVPPGSLNDSGAFVAPHENAPVLVEVPQEQKGPAPYDRKGDRLTTVDMDSATFFDAGSSQLKESGRVVLKDIAAKIASDAYKNYQVTVEGHTDDTPIASLQFPSNWELSTARASAVVHYFLEQGIPASRLRAAGYADTFPKVPNRDAQGHALPANQAQNRRVVIKLEKVEKP